MNLLALDTSSEYCSCALLAGGAIRQRIENAGQTHSLRLLPMVYELLREAGLGLRQLDGIAVGVGPGSFTGLRIATAVGQGLAFGADLPVAVIGTLEAMAWGEGEDRVVVCADARMGEVYTAAFVRDGDRMSGHGPVRVSVPADVPAPAGADWVGAGNGFARYGEALAARFGGALREVRPDVFPEARHVLGLARVRFPDGFTEPPEALVPVYVRDKVALTMAER